MIDTISQIGISLFGIAAIILVAKKNKWGLVLGLLSQPFWLLTSWINEQWGILILSIIYTGTWIYGIYEWFYKNKQGDTNKIKQQDHPWIGVDNIITNNEGKVLLIKRSKREKTFPGMWGLISGTMELGETVHEALKREAMEEVGVKVEIIRFTGRYYDQPGRHPTKTMICLPHICKIKSGTPTANQPEEVEEVRWFAPEEIKDLPMGYDHKQMLIDEGLAVL